MPNVYTKLQAKHNFQNPLTELNFGINVAGLLKAKNSNFLCM